MNKNEIEARRNEIKAAKTLAELAQAVKVGGNTLITSELTCDIQDALVKNRSIGQMAEEYKTLPFDQQQTISFLLHNALSNDTVMDFYRTLFSDTIHTKAENKHLKDRLKATEELVATRNADLEYYCGKMEEAHRENSNKDDAIRLLLREFCHLVHAMPAREIIEALWKAKFPADEIIKAYLSE